MADPPHLLKSVQNCLPTQSITLSDDIVSSEQLPDNVVSLKHVKDLINFQENSDLKLAPNLTAKHVNPGNFVKMKFSTCSNCIF
jgi:hypothetical protein